MWGEQEQAMHYSIDCYVATVIIRILRMIQFNVRNSILVVYHESNPM